MRFQYIVQSTEDTYQLSSRNHKDNKTKIKRDQETHYISVCTKFEELILIHEAIQHIWRLYPNEWPHEYKTNGSDLFFALK